MAVNIQFVWEREANTFDFDLGDGSNSTLVAPGDPISCDVTAMRGHGTFKNDDDELVASVAGFVTMVSKLVSVHPLKSRYIGQIGDVVVGRVIEVQQKRWKIDTNSRLDSNLLLSSVNLPGGELRRRSAEDELMMRQYLQEGDLISAEVQTIYQDGALSLHTRSLKYGKLSQGTLVRVSPTLIKRSKTHFHNLPCGASVILGNNGYVWIFPASDSVDGGGNEGGGFVQNLDPVSFADRDVVVRLRNCIKLLADNTMFIFDTSIMYAYEESTQYETKNLLQFKMATEVANSVRIRLQQDIQ